MRATHSSSTSPRCKPAPENSHPDTSQPLTLADRASRVEALRRLLSAPAFPAKIRLLRTHDSVYPPALAQEGTRS